ncbi:MAG: pyruvate kinase, partial [Gemmataceae bacterium]
MSPTRTQLEPLIARLQAVRAEMEELERTASSALERLRPAFRRSGANLLHYLALRRHDLRPLQEQLAGLGLSSLGRAESHVLSNIDTVLGALHSLAGLASKPSPASLSMSEGDALLDKHTELLLGPPPRGHEVRIMVTMPSEAADDYTLVHDLVKSGMDCMRVNCAHDGPEAWAQMAAHLRRAERDLNRPCRLLMDLAGPKLRTGPLEAGPQVLKYRPRRDLHGQVLAPARIWLTAAAQPAAPPNHADAVVPIDAEWLRHLERGDRIVFRDARN